MIDTAAYLPRDVASAAAFFAPSAGRVCPRLEHLGACEPRRHRHERERTRGPAHARAGVRGRRALRRGTDPGGEARPVLRTAQGAVRGGGRARLPRPRADRAARARRRAVRQHRSLHLLARAIPARRHRARARAAGAPHAVHRRARPGRLDGARARGEARRRLPRDRTRRAAAVRRGARRLRARGRPPGRTRSRPCAGSTMP